MSTEEELIHLRELRAITIRRKDELELQQARMGPRTPAEITIEIRECEESIARLDAKLLQVTVPLDVAEATGPEASIDVLRHQVKNLGDQVGTAMRWMTAELLSMREETRRWRIEQDEKRRQGARRWQTAFLILAAGFVVSLAVSVFILWRFL